MGNRDGAGLGGYRELHQAHWGNDHPANTVLNNTDWVHATFVYDKDADLGTIYLNGTADSAATAKKSPNGSGNLIIGGRSDDANAGGGVDWYNGLIDDIAIWDSILTEAQIQELANGVNPFSPVTGVDNENDGAGDGLDGDTILADGDTPQTAGTNFNWTSITASSEEYFGDFGGSEGSFDVFDNLTGGGQNKVCGNGAPQDITVGFEEPISLTHFTLTSRNDTPARDPLDFAIQGSNDGLNYENIYVRQDDTSLWTARNQTVRIDLPAASDSYLFIRYDVNRTGGANHALSEIEYFGQVGAFALFDHYELLL
ncbi:MAG: hypothetical protein ACJAVK_000428 [Akkermansiaceae bacterium]